MNEPSDDEQEVCKKTISVRVEPGFLCVIKQSLHGPDCVGSHALSSSCQDFRLGIMNITPCFCQYLEHETSKVNSILSQEEKNIQGIEEYLKLWLNCLITCLLCHFAEVLKDL